MIPIKNIIYDTPMISWSKENAQDILASVRPKRLPASKDTVGKLNPLKIFNIENAYKRGLQNELPAIIVNQYKYSQYFEVIDGRHRTVIALKYKDNSIAANVIK